MPAHKTTWAAREARFWSNLDKEGPEPEHRPGLGPCWVWKLRVNNRGYGILTWWGIGTRTAHSVAWEFTNGPVPDGLELDHLCRNRACARPSHLEPVTRLENVRRGEQAQRTRCREGHEYSPENTVLNKKGSRVCRTCRLEKQRQWRAENREAFNTYHREMRRKRRCSTQSA